MLFEPVVKVILVLVTMSLSAILSGCGESSGGPAPTPGSDSVSYLFYTNSGSIRAVDPATPTSPFSVEAGTDVVLGSEAYFFSGSYDAATKTRGNLHHHAIVYVNTNGKLYKASALKSSGPPKAMQLSNESAADKICDRDIAFDAVNPDNSQFIYRLPGDNALCDFSDDVYKMVLLGMKETDAPITAKAPVTELVDVTTDTLTGWLVHDAGALNRCDTKFASCENVMSVASRVSVVEHRRSLADQLLLNIDDVLYVYTGDTNSLSIPVYALSGANSYVIGGAESDVNNFYFSVGNAPSMIYAVPVDGSKTAALLSTDAAGISDMEISTNKLLYATDTEIKAVDTTTGVVTTLVSGEFDPIAAIYAINGNHVYYNSSHTSGTKGAPVFTLIAGVIDDDSSNKSETANALWQGEIIRASWSLADGMNAFMHIIIRAEGFNALGMGKGFAGATLRSFNTATKAEVAVLGTLPTDINEIRCSDLDANTLCQGFSSAPYQSDIFYLNAEKPASLVRVTNTPDISEGQK